jgi:hypothetical protein
MTNDLAGAAATELTLVIPAANDHLRYARLIASAVAARSGLDYDAVEDLRIAVSELCTAVTEGAADGALTLSYTGNSSGVRITGRAARGGGGTPEPVALGELSRQILDAVTDEHAFEVGDDELSFMLYRRAGLPPAT